DEADVVPGGVGQRALHTTAIERHHVAGVAGRTLGVRHPAAADAEAAAAGAALEVDLEPRAGTGVGAAGDHEDAAGELFGAAERAVEAELRAGARRRAREDGAGEGRPRAGSQSPVWLERPTERPGAPADHDGGGGGAEGGPHG